MAIKICRLSLGYAHSIPEGQSMEQVLNDACAKAGVELKDIQADFGDDYNKKSHFGNWVYTPVLDNEATKKVAAVLQTELDMHRQVLEAEDLAAFAVGEKVTIQFVSTFAFPVKEQGTVSRNDGEKITIRKKRSQTKGWQFKAGHEVTITKGWTK